MQLGEAFLEEFKTQKPEVEIEHMHLYDMDIPQIDMDLLYARAKLSFMGKTFDELSEGEQKQITAMHALADRFIAADYYVFVTPIWNFGSPAILKAFLDNLFIVNKTFTIQMKVLKDCLQPQSTSYPNARRHLLDWSDG